MGSAFPTETELLVLHLLRDSGRGLYGLELVKESGGKLKRGTVYVILSRLQDKGFVDAHTPRVRGHAGLPRPRYTLTGAGERALTAAALLGLGRREAFA
jgi:DNA-binding PadR family transcriptional regulator